MEGTPKALASQKRYQHSARGQQQEIGLPEDLINRPASSLLPVDERDHSISGVWSPNGGTITDDGGQSGKPFRLIGKGTGAICPPFPLHTQEKQAAGFVLFLF